MARRKHVSDIRKEQEASGASQADGYFAQQPVSQAEARVSGGKISSFPLSQIWPDRFQPRLIIPPDLRDRFFSGDINVYETAFEWIKRAKGEEAEEYRALDCIECGCCSYSCPATIPLVQAIRYGKAAIMAKKRNA